jgi:FkbM family methyltransferase
MPIIFSDDFGSIVAGNPLVYVDVGARGGLQGPWAEIDDRSLHVVAFEPDPGGAAALRGKRNFDVVDTALWSHAGVVDIHLAKVPGTSSVHPPNWPMLKRFPAQHYEPRTTINVATVKCDTLDSVLAGLGRRADFLKIDTQGAEYEILAGAVDALDRDVFGVIAETWTTEVHKGQHLTGEILSFMAARGFGLFDMNVAAAWHRRGADRLPHLGKRQLVGLDLLFFREPSDLPDRFANLVNSAKAAAVAELYGFPDLALEILDMVKPASSEEASRVKGLRGRLLDAASAVHAAAGLHY